MLLNRVHFLDDPPRFLFFTGKGGVGKTSLACAAAVALADAGRRVLLVSTDPASNVAQVLGQPIGANVTPIHEVPGLTALEIDPEAAASAYRERILEPVRGLLPEAELASITEQLSGSCTTEVASFNEFTDLLTNPALDTEYDHVVFDTAPTGHTIRLLQLPGSWTQFLQSGKGDASCLGPLAGLDKQRSMYAGAVAALCDRTRTRMVLVARAQPAALAEAERTRAELDEIGIRSAILVVNGVLPDAAGTDPLAEAIRLRERAALQALPERLAALEHDEVELRPATMVGLPALRSLLRTGSDDHLQLEAPGRTEPAFSDLAGLVDLIEADGHGLVLCMGKGGVGKTTVAAAIAVALAHRGHEVHLATTDPAAHLDDVLRGSVANLTVSTIDPHRATKEYRERILQTRGESLDADGRASLAEDLLSPCTEEVAVFHEFSHLVLGSRRRFVVIDTAPTGHTLLLLDAAGSYHRDVVRQTGSGLQGVRTPLMVLQDPQATKVLVVTLAEPTPVLEATALQADLERAGIRPWAWVVNASLAAARPESQFLRARAAAEVEQLVHIARVASRMAVVPFLADEPVGERPLAALVET